MPPTPQLPPRSQSTRENRLTDVTPSSGRETCLQPGTEQVPTRPPRQENTPFPQRDNRSVLQETPFSNYNSEADRLPLLPPKTTPRQQLSLETPQRNTHFNQQSGGMLPPLPPKGRTPAIPHYSTTASRNTATPACSQKRPLCKPPRSGIPIKQKEHQSQWQQSTTDPATPSVQPPRPPQPTSALALQTPTMQPPRPQSAQVPRPTSVHEPQTPTMQTPQSPTMQPPRPPRPQSAQVPRPTSAHEPQTPTMQTPQSPTMQPPRPPRPQSAQVPRPTSAHEPQTPTMHAPPSAQPPRPARPQSAQVPRPTSVHEPQTPTMQTPQSPTMQPPRPPRPQSAQVPRPTSAHEPQTPTMHAPPSVQPPRPARPQSAQVPRPTSAHEPQTPTMHAPPSVQPPRPVRPQSAQVPRPTSVHEPQTPTMHALPSVQPPLPPRPQSAQVPRPTSVHEPQTPTMHAPPSAQSSQLPSAHVRRPPLAIPPASPSMQTPIPPTNQTAWCQSISTPNNQSICDGSENIYEELDDTCTQDVSSSRMDSSWAPELPARGSKQQTNQSLLSLVNLTAAQLKDQGFTALKLLAKATMVQEPPISKVDNCTYREFITNKDSVLVMFYSSVAEDKMADLWFSKQFIKAAIVKDRKEARLGSVDCAKEYMLCNKEDVNEYPVYKLYNNGQYVGTHRDKNETDYTFINRFLNSCPTMVKDSRRCTNIELPGTSTA